MTRWWATIPVWQRTSQKRAALSQGPLILFKTLRSPLKLFRRSGNFCFYAHHRKCFLCSPGPSWNTCLVVIAPRKGDSLSCSVWTVSDCTERPPPHVDDRTRIGFYLAANESLLHGQLQMRQSQQGYCKQANTPTRQGLVMLPSVWAKGRPVVGLPLCE